MASRDPARIPEMLRLLEQVWQKQPDLRLCQLLVNHVRPTSPCPEIYYVEDDVLLRRLGVQNPPPVWLADPPRPEDQG